MNNNQKLGERIVVNFPKSLKIDEVRKMLKSVASGLSCLITYNFISCGILGRHLIDESFEDETITFKKSFSVSKLSS